MKYYAGLDIGKLHATVSKEAFRKHKFKYVRVSFYYLSKASPERVQEALDLYSGPEPGQEILLDSGAFSMMSARRPRAARNAAGDVSHLRMSVVTRAIVSAVAAGSR